MKFVIFGLSITSSWGNGHATLWRALCRALISRGHDVVFFERDVSYYAAHRDLLDLPGGEIVLYPEWDEVRSRAAAHLANADIVIITSYCWDAIAAAEATRWIPALRVFYDLDTPVTLAHWKAGETVPYLNERGLRDFDLILSYTGGQSLLDLQTLLGAPRVAPLFGSVDPAEHRPAPPRENYRASLSYLGTFAEDRQEGLERLFIEPARQRPGERFLMGGAQYPNAFPWAPNIHFVRHLPPVEHPAFYSSSRLTLNVTRAAMAASGYCPSGRLFEAAACGTAMISDYWDGLEQFFTPGQELLLARDTADVLAALELSDHELAAIGCAARERALSDHTAARRAAELESLLEAARAGAIVA